MVRQSYRSSHLTSECPGDPYGGLVGRSYGSMPNLRPKIRLFPYAVILAQCALSAPGDYGVASPV